MTDKLTGSDRLDQSSTPKTPDLGHMVHFTVKRRFLLQKQWRES